MFTWICPQCGREVPPSYTDCPDCAAKAKPPEPPAPEPPPQYQPPPPQYQPPPPQYQPPQQYQAPPQYQYPPQQQYPPQPPRQYQPPYEPPQPQAPPEPPKFYVPPPERSGLAAIPTWLMSILFALVFGGVVFGAYSIWQGLKKEPSATSQDSAPANPSAVTATGAGNNPLLKQIEVAGLRLTQNKAKKTEIRFLVVNHSGGEVQDVAGTLSLRARTSKRDEEPIGACAFKLPSLGPYESKDMVCILNTKLKVYELPDWQNLEAQLQITSP
jgi:hypothetical protein